MISVILTTLFITKLVIRMNKNITSILLILFFTTLFLFLVISIREYPPKHINCGSNAAYYKNEMVMRISSKLDYSHGKGVVYISGGIYSGNKLISHINRTVKFTGSNNARLFSWTSTDIIPSMEEKLEPELARKWLPPFYLTKGSVANLYIDRINMDSFIFSNELAPYFICSKF